MTRLRVVAVPGPGDPYLLVLDKAADVDPDAYAFAFENRPANCAGVLVFADEIEVE